MFVPVNDMTFVLFTVLPFFMLAVLSVLLDGCNKDKACFVFALGSVRSLRWVRQWGNVHHQTVLYQLSLCLY